MTRASTYAAVLLMLCATPAFADNKSKDKSKGKALYEEGLRHYNVSEYTEAIRVWKEAYLLSKRPVLLFNLGQAYRLSGDCTQALTFYDSYRREQSNLDNADELTEAENLCKAKLAEKPAEKPQDTRPPDPVPPPAVVPPPPAHTASTMRKAGVVVGIAGVVSGGIAVYFATDVSSKSSELDGYEGEWGAKQDQLEADAKRSEKLAWGLGITGVTGISLGVALYVMGGASAESSSVAVVPTRGGARVGWTVRF